MSCSLLFVFLTTLDTREYILKFLGEIGVRRLTDCVQIEPQTENFRPCPSLQAYVRQMVPWIQRCLYADDFREIYDFLVASDIKARLAAMTFAQVYTIIMYVYGTFHTLTCLAA